MREREQGKNQTAITLDSVGVPAQEAIKESRWRHKGAEGEEELALKANVDKLFERQTLKELWYRGGLGDTSVNIIIHSKREERDSYLLVPSPRGTGHQARS